MIVMYPVEEPMNNDLKWHKMAYIFIEKMEKTF